MKRASLATFLSVLVLTAAGCGNSWLSPRTNSTGTAGETPPEDHYSILLSVHNDPTTHVQNANYYKKVLAEKVGWRGLFVIHKAGRSELYWGRYRSWHDRKAEANLKTAKAYRTANGMALFAKAHLVPLPGADIGPMKWNLKNVGPAAYYSLLVAMFRDDPKQNYVGRRKFAVDYCRRLRKGGYEAYFHHGPAISHVTIGAFGAKAVTIQKGSRGDKVKINDPAIKSLQRDFEFLALNGRSIDEVVYNPQTKQPLHLPRKKTCLIRVPGKSQPGDVLYKDARNSPGQHPSRR